jgi:hypothetical protein
VYLEDLKSIFFCMCFAGGAGCSQRLAGVLGYTPAELFFV